MWKHGSRLLLVAAILGVVGGAAAQEARPVGVFVNGGRLESDALLLRDVGRTVLPMRTLFESLGARVEWDSAQRAVYAWKPDGTGVRLAVGADAAQTLRMSDAPGPGHWGQVTDTYQLEAPAMIREGRVFVPLRFASEALRADVRYAAAESAVYIRTESASATPDPEPPVDANPRPRPDRNVTARELRAALDVDLVLRRNIVDADRERDLPLQLTVRNRGDRALVVPMGGQKYDFEVVRDGMVVWRWSDGRAFIQILEQRRIAPGEELTFNARWDMRNSRGRQVPPGEYQVRGILVTAVRNGRIADEGTLTLR